MSSLVGVACAAARKHRAETVGRSRGAKCASWCRACAVRDGKARRGRAGQSWAGPAGVGGGRVVEELRTPHGRSKMTTNRLYGSMCGSRASEPSSRSRVGLHDTRTRRRLQGLGWVQPTMGGMHAVKQALLGEHL